MQSVRDTLNKKMSSVFGTGRSANLIRDLIVSESLIGTCEKPASLAYQDRKKVTG